MKTTKTSKTVVTLHPYRIILRGKNKAGRYMRAVRTIKCANMNEAYGHLATNGSDIAKTLKFEPAFTNVFIPVCQYLEVCDLAIFA